MQLHLGMTNTAAALQKQDGAHQTQKTSQDTPVT